MIICTVQFNYSGGPDYKLLLDVFKKSVQRHMPDTMLYEINIPPPRRDISKAYNLKYNTEKLEAWLHFLKTTDQDQVVFSDCDMVMAAPIYDVFDPEYDIAYTARTRTTRIPMNGGVMFVRNNEASKNFFEEFYRVNKAMYNDEKFHNQWRAKYAGMNQAAFGYMYEMKPVPILLHKYLTDVWNAVDCDWPNITDKTRLIHVKSQLRKNVLQNRQPYGNYRKAMEIWYREAGIVPMNPPVPERTARIKKQGGRRIVRRRHV